MESSLFPNTLTYLTAVTVAGVIVAVLGSVLLLSCSDYTVERSTYLRLASLLPNLLLLLGVILAQYFTAAATNSTSRDYILLGVAGFTLLCGSYFFLANAMFRSKIRNAIFCREDPVTKKKSAGYSTAHKSLFHTPEESSAGSSQSTPASFRRNVLRRNDKTRADPKMGNLNYVSDYLGPQYQLHQQHPAAVRVGMNPVPLSLFGQVPRGAGRVRRSGDAGALSGLANPAFRLDLSSDV